MMQSKLPAMVVSVAVMRPPLRRCARGADRQMCSPQMLKKLAAKKKAAATKKSSSSAAAAAAAEAKKRAGKKGRGKDKSTFNQVPASTGPWANALWVHTYARGGPFATESRVMPLVLSVCLHGVLHAIAASSSLLVVETMEPSALLPPLGMED